MSVNKCLFCVDEVVRLPIYSVVVMSLLHKQVKNWLTWIAFIAANLFTGYLIWTERFWL